jgi:hypothetical protein
MRVTYKATASVMAVGLTHYVFTVVFPDLVERHVRRHETGAPDAATSSETQVNQGTAVDFENLSSKCKDEIVKLCGNTLVSRDDTETITGTKTFEGGMTIQGGIVIT